MIKLLNIKSFYPHESSIKALVTVDRSGKEHPIILGISDHWRSLFSKYPDNFKNKKAAVRTLPPLKSELRYPVFTEAVDTERVDTIETEAEFNLVNGYKVEKPINVTLGGSLLSLEIADTPSKCAEGYMFRRHIPSGEGMLFTKQEPGSFVFWMRNTFVPLDLIFVNEFLKVTEIIRHMEPHSEELRVNKEPAVFAIEVPAGSIKLSVGEDFLY